MQAFPWLSPLFKVRTVSLTEKVLLQVASFLLLFIFSGFAFNSHSEVFVCVCVFVCVDSVFFFVRFYFCFFYFLVGRRKKRIESVCDGASFFFLVFVCFSTRMPLRAPITLLPSSKLLFVLICSFFFFQILFHVLCYPYDSNSVVVVKHFFPLFFSCSSARIKAHLYISKAARVAFTVSAPEHGGVKSRRRCLHQSRLKRGGAICFVIFFCSSPRCWCCSHSNTQRKRKRKSN